MALESRFVRGILVAGVALAVGGLVRAAEPPAHKATDTATSEPVRPRGFQSYPPQRVSPFSVRPEPFGAAPGRTERYRRGSYQRPLLPEKTPVPGSYRLWVARGIAREDMDALVKQLERDGYSGSTRHPARDGKSFDVAIQFRTLGEAEYALEHLQSLHYMFATVTWGRLIEPGPPAPVEPGIPFRMGNPRVDRSLTNTIGMELVLMPPARFMMGSDNGSDDEKPRRRVSVGRAFYIGRYEVTQEQFEKVMGTNPSRFKGKDLPVETVSWADANEFCRKLSAMESDEYRLPTESEWEWACRANSTTEYYWGDSFDGRFAVTRENSGGKTHVVGSLKPNRAGLYDMSGNLWEWCADAYSDPPQAEKSPEPGGSAGGKRVLRGGSWNDSSDRCRSAARQGAAPNHVDDSHGFRVARNVTARDAKTSISAEMLPGSATPQRTRHSTAVDEDR